jgi:hypothetical protein
LGDITQLLGDITQYPEGRTTERLAHRLARLGDISSGPAGAPAIRDSL